MRDYLAHVAKLESSAPVAAPSAPAASKPFAFPAAPAPAPAAKPFNFGAPAKPEAPSKPAFIPGAPPPKADAPKPAFSFGAAPPSTSAFNFGAPAPKAPASNEDDAMPKEERVAVQKADDGDETTAFESRCALRRYDKPEGEKPQWRDLGKGQLRVTRHKTSKDEGAARVVLRTRRRTSRGEAMWARSAEYIHELYSGKADFRVRSSLLEHHKPTRTK